MPLFQILRTGNPVTYPCVLSLLIAKLPLKILENTCFRYILIIIWCCNLYVLHELQCGPVQRAFMIKEFAASEMLNVLTVIKIKLAFLMNMLICGEAEHAFCLN